MAWAELVTLKLKPDWVYTLPTEGIYFRVVHSNYDTGGKFLISQFDESGYRFGNPVVVADTFPELIYLPKPASSTTRKLGVKLLAGNPWTITLEVGDYTEQGAEVDLSPIANQLIAISSAITEVDDAIDNLVFSSVDLTPIDTKLDEIDAHVLSIPLTDLTTVHSKLDAIINRLSVGRETISITTPQLAPGAVHNTTIPLGKTFLLLKITTSSPAWVRLYTSPAYRAADANRPITQSPTTSPNGIISEDITTANNLTIDLNGNGKFQGIGSSQESPPSGNIAIAIVNTSNTAQAITVSYNRIILEL